MKSMADQKKGALIMVKISLSRGKKRGGKKESKKNGGPVEEKRDGKGEVACRPAHPIYPLHFKLKVGFCLDRNVFVRRQSAMGGGGNAIKGSRGIKGCSLLFPWGVLGSR